MTDHVEIVPGVTGPSQFRIEGPSPDSAVIFAMEYRFSARLGRYVCSELRATNPDGVSTEALRWVAVADMLKTALTAANGPIRELPNPEHIEPWGLHPPADVAEHPTSRALRWVGHLYRYGWAVSDNPTATVAETLRLPRSTAGRWVRMARQAGHLGAAEVGKAGI
jgi:hypothetical protein